MKEVVKRIRGWFSALGASLLGISEKKPEMPSILDEDFSWLFQTRTKARWEMRSHNTLSQKGRL